MDSPDTISDANPVSGSLVQTRTLKNYHTVSSRPPGTEYCVCYAWVEKKDSDRLLLAF